MEWKGLVDVTAIILNQPKTSFYSSIGQHCLLHAVSLHSHSQGDAAIFGCICMCIYISWNFHPLNLSPCTFGTRAVIIQNRYRGRSGTQWSCPHCGFRIDSDLILVWTPCPHYSQNRFCHDQLWRDGFDKYFDSAESTWNAVWTEGSNQSRFCSAHTCTNGHQGTDALTTQNHSSQHVRSEFDSGSI